MVRAGGPLTPSVFSLGLLHCLNSTIRNNYKECTTFLMAAVTLPEKKTQACESSHIYFSMAHFDKRIPVYQLVSQ